MPGTGNGHVGHGGLTLPLERMMMMMIPSTRSAVFGEPLDPVPVGLDAVEVGDQAGRDSLGLQMRFPWDLEALDLAFGDEESELAST
jgi:hypothetical protein